MKVLLTGASGFLGQHILAELEKSHDVYTLSREGKSDAKHFQVNLATAVPSFKNHSFDLVVHASGKAHVVPKTPAAAADMFAVNHLGTENLLKGLNVCPTKPSMFILVSTVAVYGLHKGVQINEGTPLKAIDPYGKSKIMAEQCVQEWCRQRGVSCVILRLPLVVGKNPPGNLGAMINAIKKGLYFNIGKGEARKSMVLAEDVAVFIARLSHSAGIYNLTDGAHPSFQELGDLIAGQLGRKKPRHLPASLVYFVAKAATLIFRKFPLNQATVDKMTNDLTFDDSKARKLAGWRSRLVLKEFRVK